MNETFNEKLIRLLREAVRLVQIADRGVISEALGDAHTQFLYEATRLRIELEEAETSEEELKKREELTKLFTPTHEYKNHRYEELDMVTIKDREAGRWISGVLYRAETNGELYARELGDFLAKFTATGTASNYSDK